MKTLIMFYSMDGHTRKAAYARMQQLQAEGHTVDIEEMKYTKKRGKGYAYFFGCFDAMRRKQATLAPFERPLSENGEIEGYDNYIIATPIWAGNPAPPAYNALEAVPDEKSVELIFCSRSGNIDHAIRQVTVYLEKFGNPVRLVKSYKAADLDTLNDDIPVEDILPDEIQERIKADKAKNKA